MICFNYILYGKCEKSKCEDIHSNHLYYIFAIPEELRNYQWYCDRRHCKCESFHNIDDYNNFKSKTEYYIEQYGTLSNKRQQLEYQLVLNDNGYIIAEELLENMRNIIRHLFQWKRTIIGELENRKITFYREQEYYVKPRPEKRPNNNVDLYIFSYPDDNVKITQNNNDLKIYVDCPSFSNRDVIVNWIKNSVSTQLQGEICHRKRHTHVKYCSWETCKSWENNKCYHTDCNYVHNYTFSSRYKLEIIFNVQNIVSYN